jgi:hypothetical protein
VGRADSHHQASDHCYRGLNDIRFEPARGQVMIEVGGLLGLIWLIIVIYAIVKVLGSSAGTGAKVLWVLLILVLPVIGVILWLLLGPKG